MVKLIRLRFVFQWMTYSQRSWGTLKMACWEHVQIHFLKSQVHQIKSCLSSRMRRPITILFIFLNLHSGTNLGPSLNVFNPAASSPDSKESSKMPNNQHQRIQNRTKFRIENKNSPKILPPPHQLSRSQATNSPTYTQPLSDPEQIKLYLPILPSQPSNSLNPLFCPHMKSAFSSFIKLRNRDSSIVLVKRRSCRRSSGQSNSICTLIFWGGFWVSCYSFALSRKSEFWVLFLVILRFGF